MIDFPKFVITMYIRTLQFLVTFLIFLSISCTSGHTEHARLATVVVDPGGALTQAALLYRDRGDLDNARKAIEVLDKARDRDNRNYELEWKFARYSYFVGSRRNLTDEESEKVLTKALEAARIAKRMEPKKPDGHFWYGAILGELSRRSPVTVGTVSISKIKDSMNAVIELDPKYEGASAYDALGQLELATRGLAGGDAKRALEYFKKAHSLNPDNAYARLHLGEAYLALNQDAEAKKYLQSLMSMPPSEDFAPEQTEAQERAAKLLREKF